MLSAYLLILASMTVGSASTSAPAPTELISACMLSKVTDADRAVLVRWAFIAEAQNPLVSDLAVASAEQREKISRDAGSVMNRLIFDDCRKQMVDAMTVGGAGAFKEGLRAFGKVLGLEVSKAMLSDSATQSQIRAMSQYVDRMKFNALELEAGLPESYPDMHR